MKVIEVNHLLVMLSNGDSFTVKLQADQLYEYGYAVAAIYQYNRVRAIKAARGMLGIGLREAKGYAEDVYAAHLKAGNVGPRS
jgi:ribosomal protein L7/L12